MKTMNNLPILDAAQQQGNNGSSMILMIVIYVAIFGALYFFLIRPNSKRKKEEAELRNSIEIGNEIVTIGGIMGRIVAIKDDEEAIVIETGSDRVKMKMKKWCIQSVVTDEPAAPKPAKRGFFSRKSKEDTKAE